MTRPRPILVAASIAAGLALPAPAAAGAVSFTGPTNFDAGLTPASVATGDFNGDSTPDLAVANGPEDAPSGVSILIGEAGGGFEPLVEYPVSTQATSVAVGDFNGDSDPDLAVSGWDGISTPGAVSVFLGADGGFFSGPTDFPAGNRPMSVAVGDFDADSDQDLAIANDWNYATVLLGDGDGGFAEQNTLSTPAVTALSSVVVGEFGGGTEPDLAFANGPSNEVLVYIGEGEGDFFGPVEVGVGNSPESVAAGEFNGDGDQDLAVTNQGDDDVSILLGSGGGGFSAPTDFATGDTPAGVAIGDFDADSDEDVVVANLNGDDVTALSGDGAGGFTASGEFDAGDAPASLAAGEFYGSAVTDLAVANSGSGNVSILRGLADPRVSIDATDSEIGGAIHASPTLPGGASPTGDVNIQAFHPDDPTCSNPPAASFLAEVGDTVEFVPSQLGEYRWSAQYLGDDNNVAASATCTAVSTVSQATPDVTTVATSGPVGSAIHATATLAGAHDPGGQITFRAYGPDDPSCEETPAFTVVRDVDANGPYGSGDFTNPQLGAYTWTASYSGDLDNEAEASPCGSPDATSTVGQAEPAVSAAATDGAIGEAVEATATLTGGFSHTGSITFDAYGPDDPTCSGEPAYSAAVHDVEPGTPSYASGELTPVTAGTYLWVASYGGDANNEPAVSTCGAAGATSVVAQAEPVLAAAADGSGTVGEAVGATATLASGFDPGGQVTFRVYGPDDSGCAGPPVFTAVVGVDAGNGVYSSPPFTPAMAGEYAWTASYSGDPNNEIAGSSCGAAGTTTTVAPAPPAPCPTLTISAARAPAPGRRALAATVSASAPASLAVEAQLRYRSRGKARTVQLGGQTVVSGETLVLRIPNRLRRAKVTKAVLQLSGSATPTSPSGCPAQAVQAQPLAMKLRR